MNTILIYLIPLSFNLAFAIYTRFQLEDMNAGAAKAQRKWHPVGGIMRFQIYALAAAEIFFPAGIWDLVISGVISWPLWDILINIIALHQKWNYVGTTAETDKKFGQMKWYAYAVALIGAGIADYFSHKKQQK